MSSPLHDRTSTTTTRIYFPHLLSFPNDLQSSSIGAGIRGDTDGSPTKPPIPVWDLQTAYPLASPLVLPIYLSFTISLPSSGRQAILNHESSQAGIELTICYFLVYPFYFIFDCSICPSYYLTTFVTFPLVKSYPPDLSSLSCFGT